MSALAYGAARLRALAAEATPRDWREADELATAADALEALDQLASGGGPAPCVRVHCPEPGRAEVLVESLMGAWLTLVRLEGPDAEDRAHGIRRALEAGCALPVGGRDLKPENAPAA